MEAQIRQMIRDQIARGAGVRAGVQAGGRKKKAKKPKKDMTPAELAAEENPWIKHVKAYAKKHGVPYGQAMVEAKDSYVKKDEKKSKKAKAAPGVVAKPKKSKKKSSKKLKDWNDFLVQFKAANPLMEHKEAQKAASVMYQQLKKAAEEQGYWDVHDMGVANRRFMPQ